MVTENRGISPAILTEIQKIGRDNALSKMVLFGSRARLDHSERSDIDLAIWAKDASHYYRVSDALEHIDTLLMFDLVDMNSGFLSRELKEEIERDGVVLYEEV